MILGSDLVGQILAYLKYWDNEDRLYSCGSLQALRDCLNNWVSMGVKS